MSPANLIDVWKSGEASSFYGKQGQVIVLHYSYKSGRKCANFKRVKAHNTLHYPAPYISLHCPTLYCIRIRTRGGIYGQIYHFAWRSSRGQSPTELLKTKGCIWPYILSRVLIRTVCTVLSCIELHCAVLYCALLYFTLLYCTLPYFTVLNYTVMYCTVLHWLHCSVLYWTIVYWTVVNCIALTFTHYAALC